eukprot:1768895-Pyramimonas_sp.AAC.1
MALGALARDPSDPVVEGAEVGLERRLGWASSSRPNETRIFHRVARLRTRPPARGEKDVGVIKRPGSNIASQGHVG